MTKSLFLGLAFVLSLTAYSQNFIPGKITTPDGQETSGFIKKSGPLDRSQKVEFKPSPDAEPVTYRPEDISGYRVGGELVYRVANVTLQAETYERKLFVRVVATGQFLKLLRLDYQIEEEPELFIEYENTFYFLQRPGEELLKLDQSHWKKELKALQSECPEKGEGSTTPSQQFTERDLANAVLAYNQCMGDETPMDYVLAINGAPLSINFGLGMARTTLSPETPRLNKFDNTAGLNPLATIYLNIPLSKERFLIRTGLCYSRKSMTGTQTVIALDFFDNAGEAIELNADLSLHYLGPSVGMKYVLGNGGVQPYVVGEFYYSIRLQGSASAEETEDIIASNPSQIFLGKRAIEPYRGNFGKDDVGFCVGAGIDLKAQGSNKFYAELRYTQGRTFLNRQSSLFISNRTLGLVVGYRFQSKDKSS